MADFMVAGDLDENDIGKTISVGEKDERWATIQDINTFGDWVHIHTEEYEFPFAVMLYDRVTFADA